MPRRFRRMRRRFGRRRRGQRTSMLKRLIMRVTKPEFKVFDTDIAATYGSAAGGFTNVTQVAQGDGAGGRTGNRITIRSIGFRMFVAQADPGAVATAIPNCVVRLMLVQDTRPNSGGTPIITDILAASAGGYAENWKQVNTANGNRFRVLWDKYFPLETRGNLVVYNSGTAAVNYLPAQRAYRTFKVYKRLKKPIVATFTGANANQWDRNALWMVGVSSLTIAGGAPGSQGVFRIRYTDD